jgi:hypothetical protein
MAKTTPKIPKLKGSENWELWSIRMSAVLAEKSYFDALNPPEAEPTPEPSRTTTRAQAAVITAEEEEISKEAATKAEQSLKALALIRLNLADGLLLQTRNENTAFLLYNKLKRLYKPKGFIAEFLICRELFDTTLAKANNIEAYLNKIKRLNDDLTARDLKIPDQVIMAWTFNNLTPEFENIVAIITQNIRDSTQIDLDRTFSQLIDEARRLKSKESETALTIKPDPYKSKKASQNTKRQKIGKKQLNLI